MRTSLIIAGLALTSHIFAGGGITDPVEMENYAADNLTSANSATQIVNQAQQINNQFQSIKYQAQNLGHVNNYQWQNIKGLVQQLDSTTQQGQALSYASSNLDSAFRQKYPNYSNSQQGQTDYQKSFQTWNTTTLDTLRGTLDAAGMNANDFKTEQDVLQQLEEQGKTAKGRMQVLQVSSEISAQNVNQLQELKRVIVSQTNAQNAYMAYKTSKDSYDEQSLQNLVSQSPDKFPEYQNNNKLGEIPKMGSN